MSAKLPVLLLFSLLSTTIQRVKGQGIGYPCAMHEECTNKNCIDGVCQCSLSDSVSNGGCPRNTHLCVELNEKQKSRYSTQYTQASFHCMFSKNDTHLLPIGAECWGDCQCSTGLCFGYSNAWNPLLPGVCTCNSRTGRFSGIHRSGGGCPEGYVCTEVIGGDMGVSPGCYLAVGSDCRAAPDKCVTGNCAPDGLCHCLPSRDFHNSGCPTSSYCSWSNTASWVGEVAQCVPKKFPGEPCESEFSVDCTGQCFEGVCACTVHADYVGFESDCPSGEICLGSSSENAWEGPFTCRQRNPLGAPCETFSDCETGVCFEGVCQCHEFRGCAENEVCVGTTWGWNGWEGPFKCVRTKDIGAACDEDSILSLHYSECNCVNGVCQGNYTLTSCVEELLTELSATVPKEMGYKNCTDDSECKHKNCHDGICQCNPSVAAEVSGCPEDTHECRNILLDSFLAAERGIKSGSFDCVAKALLPIGKPCFGACQCRTGVCHRYDNKVNPWKPGHCACDIKTNNGCSEGLTCFDRYVPTEDDPQCYASIGSACGTPETGLCSSQNCQDGLCFCSPASWHNVGCPNTEYCVANDSMHESEYKYSAVCVEKKRVGEECDQNGSGMDCRSGNCWAGVCACNHLQSAEDSGCQAGESCLGIGVPLLGLESLPRNGPYVCAERLPIGYWCTDFSDCESGVCFANACQCSVDLNLGCESAGEICIGEKWDDKRKEWIGPYHCETLKPVGSECSDEQEIHYSECNCYDGVCQDSNFSITSCVPSLASSSVQQNIFLDASASPSKAVTYSPTKSPTASAVKPVTELLPTESPTEGPIGNPTSSPTKPISESSTENPTEPVTEPPTKPATESTTESATESPTEPPRKPGIESLTESPTVSLTKPLTEVSTESPSPANPVTASPTESPTASLTNPITDVSTESPLPTNPVTASPTESPTSSSPRPVTKSLGPALAEANPAVSSVRGASGSSCALDLPVASIGLVSSFLFSR